jgi:hypothetical protein
MLNGTTAPVGDETAALQKIAYAAALGVPMPSDVVAILNRIGKSNLVNSAQPGPAVSVGVPGTPTYRETRPVSNQGQSFNPSIAYTGQYSQTQTQPKKPGLPMWGWVALAAGGGLAAYFALKPSKGAR